jgi:hypothetical protein
MISSRLKSGAGKVEPTAIPTDPKRKHGRSRKGESRPIKKLKRLERQLKMKPGKALKELDTACAWSCKTNATVLLCSVERDVGPFNDLVTGKKALRGETGLCRRLW